MDRSASWQQVEHYFRKLRLTGEITQPDGKRLVLLDTAFNGNVSCGGIGFIVLTALVPSNGGTEEASYLNKRNLLVRWEGIEPPTRRLRVRSAASFSGLKTVTYEIKQLLTKLRVIVECGAFSLALSQECPRKRGDLRLASYWTKIASHPREKQPSPPYTV